MKTRTTAISIQAYDRFSLTAKSEVFLAVAVSVVSCPKTGHGMLDIFTGLDPMPLYVSPTCGVWIHS